MLKRYYSIEEAICFLISENKQIMTRADVLMLAMCEDIRLCVWVDEELTLLQIDEYDPKHPTAGPVDYYHFKGYIQIPGASITPIGSEVTYSPDQFIEVIKYNGPSIAEVVYPLVFSCITSNYDNALIPAEDLLNLSSAHKEKPQTEKPLTTNERNSLLTIIGLMAKDGYRDDLSKPYSLASSIQSVADSLGINISDDTIAKKLKAAKEILDENSNKINIAHPKSGNRNPS